MKPSISELLRLIKKEKAFFSLGLLMQLAAKAIEAWLPLAISLIIFPVNLTSENIDRAIGEGYSLFMPVILWLSFELSAAFFRNLFASKVERSLRGNLFDHLLALPIPFFDHAKGGILATHLSDDVEKIREMLADSLIPLIGNIFIFFFILALAFSLNPLWGTIFFLFFPFTAALFLLFRKEQKLAFDIYRGALLEQNRFLQEHLSGRSLFQLYEDPEKEAKDFEQRAKKAERSIFRISRSFSLFGEGIDLLIGSIWILATLGFTYLGGEATDFMAFTLWAAILFRPLIELANRFNTLLSGFSSLKKVKKILNEPKEKDQGSFDLQEIKTIEFQNVSFYYRKDTPVIKNISFSLEGRVGIVGFTGAGKTTLHSLLLRFYSPQEGQILINGRSIDCYHLKDIRRELFPLLQDPPVIRSSYEENFNLYSKRTVKQTSPVWGLSEGEKQLLALDRAEFASPSCLLLDEATGSIDIATEKALVRKINSLLDNRIAIVIAHRLSTLRHLDEIMVLNEGEIREKGPFNELIQSKGIFYELWKFLLLEESQTY
jgi:ABC-type multidrug transport system fused ATPase/permease subunit